METEEVKLDAQVTNQEKLIQEYYKNEESIERNKQVRAEIVGVRTNLDNTKEDIKKLSKKLLELNGKVSALKNQKETITEKINEVKNLEDQHKLFEYYLNALSKDGVSYELISKALPMIEGEVNNILTQIVEFGMQLEMDGKNINAYIVYDDQKWSLEMCSGMERFISGLAIRIALINVCNLPRPNFLVIDEGFGTLDSENLTSLYMLFSYLKTQFDFVMIISHIDSMRDVVDTLLEVKKDSEGFSHVKF
jgi:DNA repair exonuclease SbcCD ATPase subunit